MSNMSYCRFENTANDLGDCLEHMDDKLSEAERRARRRLVKLCASIADEYTNDDGNLAAELLEAPVETQPESKSGNS